MIANGDEKDKQLYSWLSKIKQCIEENIKDFTYPTLDGQFNQTKKDKILNQIINEFRVKFIFEEGDNTTEDPPPNDGISDEYHYISNIIECIKNKLSDIITNMTPKANYLSFNNNTTTTTTYSKIPKEKKEEIVGEITKCIQEQIDLIVNHTTLQTPALNAGPGQPNPVQQLKDFVQTVMAALTKVQNKNTEAKAAETKAKAAQAEAEAAAAAAQTAADTAYNQAAILGAPAGTKQNSLTEAMKQKDIATTQLTLAQAELAKAQAAQTSAPQQQQHRANTAMRSGPQLCPKKLTDHHNLQKY
jgi:hypothetical protein